MSSFFRDPPPREQSHTHSASERCLSHLPVQNIGPPAPQHGLAYAQQLLVIAARALVRTELIREIAANLPVVFHGRPDSDVDGCEHCPLRDH
jgi:hypothetical protein